MKQIGIKLADGSFYPLLEEGTPSKTMLDLTTASDNQTTVAVDLYSSDTGLIEDAEYIDTLQIDNLVSHMNGEPSISFSVALDENDELVAEITDPESGASSNKKISLPVLRSHPSGVSSEHSGAGVAAGLAAGGVLAAALKHTQKDDDFDFSDLDLPEDIDLTKSDNAPADDFTAPAVGENVSFAADDDFALPQFDDDAVQFTRDASFTGDEAGAFSDINISVPDSAIDDDVVSDDFPSFDEHDSSSREDSSSVFAGGVALGAVAASAHDDNAAFEEDFFSDIGSNDTNFFSDTDSSERSSFDEQYNTSNTDEELITKTQSQESLKKKTKLPVLICLLCALICIIATILILFVIPSRFNVFTTRTTDETVARVLQPERTGTPSNVMAQPETREQIQQQSAPAKVNEVVVAPKAETVVPEKPASSTRLSSDDVVYRIKWGDTLWDIAEAYYKNPWRYQRIARYNNIRNPDYIISGTTIIIPAE